MDQRSNVTRDVTGLSAGTYTVDITDMLFGAITIVAEVKFMHRSYGNCKHTICHFCIY
ncbi:MAG: hypothetical protein IPQ11_16665 [Bacteroidetes bacterium]|nr:hypothetical protein [Bacteroidota bacterium]